jgi:hypothetical protein
MRFKCGEKEQFGVSEILFSNYFLRINGYLYYMLGRHFGLTDGDLGKRLRACLESSADE